MSATLPIYTCQAAPAPLAGYLQRLLQPVARACCFERGLPVEVRQTGMWGGWCPERQCAPDGRVVLSTRICFFTPENIVSVYLHESAHRFLERLEVAAHGPEFFCLNAILLLRSAAFFRLDSLLQLDLYDLQDAPAELDNEPGWRGVVLNWALPVAAELAASNTSAEVLADAVCQRWQQFLQEREHSRVLAAQQILVARKKTAAAELQIEDLQSSLFVARTFLAVGWMCFLSVCFFVF